MARLPGFTTLTTAHIRPGCQIAVRGATGLVIVACAAGVVSGIDVRADEGTGWLVRLVWYTIAVAAALAVLSLLLALVGWIVHRRRRGGLDAAGAQAVGELRARIANPDCDDQA